MTTESSKPDARKVVPREAAACKVCGQMWAVQRRGCPRLDCPDHQMRQSIDAAPAPAREWSDAEAKGTFNCPVCGHNTPHSHSEDEIRGWIAAQAGRFGVDVLVLSKERAAAEISYRESERGKFEKWTEQFPARPWSLKRSDEHKDLHDSGRQYLSIGTNILWDAWNAAVAGLSAQAAPAAEPKDTNLDTEDRHSVPVAWIWETTHNRGLSWTRSGPPETTGFRPLYDVPAGGKDA